MKIFVVHLLDKRKKSFRIEFVSSSEVDELLSVLKYAVDPPRIVVDIEHREVE